MIHLELLIVNQWTGYQFQLSKKSGIHMINIIHTIQKGSKTIKQQKF